MLTRTSFEKDGRFVIRGHVRRYFKNGIIFFFFSPALKKEEDAWIDRRGGGGGSRTYKGNKYRWWEFVISERDRWSETNYEWNRECRKGQLFSRSDTREAGVIAS